MLSPLSEITAWSTDLMFLEDKQGIPLFFPRGECGKGFILPDRNIKKHIVRFFRWSMIILFIISMLFAALSVKEPWSILVGFIFWICSWGLAWFLYVYWVTNPLLPSHKSYQEIVLEKVAPEGEAVWETKQRLKIVNHPSRVTYNTWKDFFNWKHIFARLPSGVIAISPFFLSLVIIGLELAVFPKGYTGQPIEEFLLILIIFLWGLSGYLFLRLFAAEKRTRSEWISQGSGFIVIMVGPWSLVLYLLYRDLIQPLFNK